MKKIPISLQDKVEKLRSVVDKCINIQEKVKNILFIFDYGTNDEEFFIVMELGVFNNLEIFLQIQKNKKKDIPEIVC
jgi:hypothetical protein